MPLQAWMAWMDSLLPRRCWLCGALAQGSINLCAGCRDDLPVLSPRTCRCCARPVAQGTRCGQCLHQPPAFTSTVAALRYAPLTECLVHRFKFAGDPIAGSILACCLARCAARAPRPDRLLPVPLSRTRLQRRGFDQSWELARAIGKNMGISATYGAVRRFSEHVPQSTLPDWRARRRNVANVFHVEPHAVAGEHLAIVDDVMTSGATADALARQLLNAGARRVDVWVACRAGLPGPTHSSVEVDH